MRGRRWPLHGVLEWVTDPSRETASGSHGRDRGDRRPRLRWAYGAMAVILVWCLWQGRAYVRQQHLNQALASAIVANQDQEAMEALDQGADTRMLYYAPSPVV